MIAFLVEGSGYLWKPDTNFFKMFPILSSIYRRGERCFILFGHFNEADHEQKSVVFRARRIDDAYILDAPTADFEVMKFFMIHQGTLNSSRPVYVVEGDAVETNSLGLPILKNIKIIQTIEEENIVSFQRMELDLTH